jgi:hypothetical protein
VVNRYSHFIKTPFLNVYLVASATAMGINNSRLEEYKLKIKTNNYYDEQDADIDYIKKIRNIF